MSREEDRGAFIWYELMTSDPEDAKSFYDAVIGWDMQADGQTFPGGSEYRMIGRADGGSAGGVLTISEDMKQHGVKPGWFPYVHTPDVDATCAALVEAGGAVHMPPTDMGVGRIAMVSDPWHAVFYVMDPVPPADRHDAKSDVFCQQPQHVRWNTLWTGDVDAALELYGELFGWSKQGAMPMGDRGDYVFIQRGSEGVGAIGPALSNGDGPRWEIHIGVDDIDRAAAEVLDRGGTHTNEIGEIPGGDFAVYCRDPQGAAFGIVGPRKG